MSGAHALAAPAAPATKGWGERIALFFCGFGIYYYLDAQIPFLRGVEGVSDGPDPINAALQMLLLLVGMGYAVWNWRRLPEIVRDTAPFIALFALALISILWSQYPMATFRRCIGLGTQYLFAFLLFQHLGFVGVMRVTLAVVLIAGGLSLVEVVLHPAAAFDTAEAYSNALRGVFLQKNSFGAALIAGAFALAYLVLRKGTVGWRDAAMALVLLVLLALSRSATSVLLTLMVFGITLAVLSLRRGGLWAGMILVGMTGAATVVLLFLAFLGVEGMFDLIGRDATLTGRTDVWDAVDRRIAERPLLGHGFAAFWVAGSRPMELVWIELVWNAPDAHHGLREIALQLGLVGQVAVVLAGLATAVLAASRLAGPRRMVALWTLMVVATAAIRAQTEANLFRGDFLLLTWILAWLALASPQGDDPPASGRDA